MRVSFCIPGTPEGKRRPRVHTHTGFPVVHAAPADKQREKLIRELAREAMAGQPAFVGPVAVYIDAVFEPAASWSAAKKRAALAGYWHTSKPDRDNIEKSVLDGLNPDRKAKKEADRAPFCLLDDAQVCAGGTRKRYGSPARIEVVIESVAPPPPRPQRRTAA